MQKEPHDQLTAEHFLRSEDLGVFALIRFGDKFDQLRITVKSDKADRKGEQIGWMMTTNLPLDDEDKWEAKYVAAARTAHKFWRSLQVEKNPRR